MNTFEILDKDELIQSIFRFNFQPTNTCLIKDIKNISKLYEFFIICDEDEKISILNVIEDCCCKVSHNSKILTSVNSSETNNLIIILCNTYLATSNDFLIKNIQKLLTTITNNISVKKENLDYIYQCLSHYFRNCEEISCKLMDKYINLLKIFYGENLNNYDPKNYFYFSGSSSIRVNELKLEEERIKLKNGCVISLWFKIEGFPTEINKNQSDLFQIVCTKNTNIQFSLNVDKLIIKNLPQINLSYKFSTNWTYLTLIIKPGNLFSETDFTIILPESVNSFKIPQFDCNCEIIEINFFNNFIGQVSTIMFHNKFLSQDIMKQFIDENNNGVYTEKALMNLNQIKNDKDHIDLPKTLEKKKEKNILELNRKIVENLRILYIPTRFNNKMIFDVTGKYNGYFNSENMFCNININNFFQKNIFYLGGINSLLPIIELLYMRNIMTEELLLNYLELIFYVLNYRKKNIKNALETNFFKMLSIFLEKFDSKAFSKQVSELLLCMGKSLFAVIDEVDLASSFFEDILLNERIFTKFNINVQMEYWMNLYKFYLRDVPQIVTFIKMEKIVHLLRYYDKNRLFEYCCNCHAEFFDIFDKKVMSPDLNSKLESFTCIMELSLLYNENPDDFRQLIILLIFDLSPCLQKIIIIILISYLKNKDKKIENKRKIIGYLLNYNLFDILQYVYNTALIDVRCEIINLLKELTKSVFSDFIKIKIHLDQKFIPFLKDCLLPNYLSINLNTNKEKIEEKKDIDVVDLNIKIQVNEEVKQENLEKYLNKEKLQYHIEVLYNNLIFWMLDKSNDNSSEFIDDKDNIVNPFVIHFVKNLINVNLSNKKLTQSFFQDMHLLLISNKKNCFLMFQNKEFYLWLVETTFLNLIELEENNSNTSNIIINDLGRKIHSDLIINSILYDERVRSQPMTNIHYLLSWGIYTKNKYSNNKKNLLVNSYIKSYIEDSLFSIKEKLKLISPNVTIALWENFAVLTLLSYEYITFYNQEKMLKLDASSLADWGYDRIIVPRGIFSGLNLLQGVYKEEKRKNELIRSIWSDYDFYMNIYSIYSHFWDKSLFDSNNIDIIMKYEHYASNMIVNKKSKDVFADIINLLFLVYRPKDKNEYPNIVVKVISNMFMITLSMIHNDVEIKFWLDEYERFLIFLLIASCNLDVSRDNYTLIQECTMDIVCFGLCFLIDEYFHTRKTVDYQSLFAETIKHIFMFLTITFKSINDHLETKKKDSTSKLFAVINNLFMSNKELTKCSVYRIFNELILTREGIPLLNAELLNKLKISNYIDVPELFEKEYWKNGLTQNNLLKNRCKIVMDFFCYETIIRDRYDMMRTYKPFNDANKMINNYEINNLKRNLYNIIQSFLPNLENENKEFQNKQFFKSKVKRLQYKYLKKKLFRYIGCWSDRELFFEKYDRLKFKLHNHYTNYFVKPLLTPIIDIDYYLPKFTKFDSKNLFKTNENNLNYRISLNVDDILKEDQEFKIDTQGKENNEVTIIQKVYQNSHEKTSKSLNEFDKFDVTYPPKYYDLNDNSKEKTKNNIFSCCLIKISHHIKGTLEITKDGIYFKPNIQNFIDLKKKKIKINNLTETFDDSDPDYDQFRETCYGSSITLHNKDKDILLYFWPFSDIKYIIKKRYYYKRKAFEFFTFLNKSYYFSFTNFNQRTDALKLIFSFIENKREIILDLKEIKEKEDLVVCIENTLTKKLKNEKFSHKLENWVNWKMSNFELLSWLNFFSSRSYVDLTQYPVFPWIIKNYKDDVISLEKDFRDLDSPMGMLEIEDKKSKERKKKCLEEYMNESNFFKLHKRHYGSHYSNPIYVSHYLMRLFPQAVISIELQGAGFDDPNRLFFSVGNSFLSSATQQGDVRELIPEFYYLPEMFINLNNLNFGLRSDELKNLYKIDDVELPLWAENPYDFVLKMKDSLESEEISYRLNDWFDLIFGYKQKGVPAEIAGNLFDNNSYEDVINIDNVENKGYYMRCAEFGLTPSQLISEKPFPKRNLKENTMKGIQITECKDLKVFINKSHFLNTMSKENSLIIHLKVLEKDLVLCVMNNNTLNLCRFNGNDFSLIVKIMNKTFISESESQQLLAKKTFLENEYYLNFPICVYSNGKIIVQGGFFDGRINLAYEEKNKFSIINYFTDINFPVNTLKIDVDEKYAFAGNFIGNIFVYSVNIHLWSKIKVLIDHFSPITDININENLNLFSTSSIDGYTNIYTLPRSKLFMSIKLKEADPIDNVFLSAYPLPVCVIFCSLQKLFFTYSINGKFMSKQIESSSHLMSPKVFTDINFRDYLVYGTNNGEVIIRSFPSMTIFKIVLILERKWIKCLDLTEDKNYIYVTLYNEKDVYLIKDPFNYLSPTKSDNVLIDSFGF